MLYIKGFKITRKKVKTLPSEPYNNKFDRFTVSNFYKATNYNKNTRSPNHNNHNKNSNNISISNNVSTINTNNNINNNINNNTNNNNPNPNNPKNIIQKRNKVILKKLKN